MWRRFTELFTPFAVIARELTHLRQLYEAELLSRKPPVYLLTEKPKDSDTEVYYGEEDEHKSRLREMLDEWNNVSEED
jgi:hypothetical protein